MRELLEQQLHASRRSGRPFGVILSDIDGFKAINDTFGHDAGDQALREVAGVLRRSRRAQDTAARWGGEEFLFLLPDTDPAGARDAAERLRRAIEAAGLTIAGKPLPLTMTFGLTTASGAGTIDAVIRRADRALYQGKAQGRNRVVSEEEPPG
jgi:diguanylate cyclase (GGDEF)-like protein